MSVAELLICPASDPTGTPIETWTDEDFLDLRLEISLNDLGKNSVKIPRGLWEGSSLDAGESYYVRVNVPYIEATNPFWGFWLIGGQFILVHPDERGGENVTIGGPGPAFILTKAVLNHEQWTPHIGVYVQDGNWYWSGKNYGQILSDLINEDAASNHPALDAMETPGWDATDDVDGNPWEQFGGIFSLPVGTNYLDAVRELQKADKLDVWVTPKLNLRAFTAYGRDLSGNSYGAGVVRFVGSEVTPAENHNILDDLIRHKDGGRNFSHVLVLGNDRRENSHIIEGSPIHKWVTDPDWTAGDAVHQGFMSYETNSRDILERAGQRLIRRSKDRSGRMVECEVMPGQDEANGLYLPGDGSTDRGNYWIGDTVTFKTGGGDDFDLFNRDLVIAKIRMQLDVAANDANNAAKGLSWRTWIETGDDIQPSSSAASAKNMSSGGAGCRCIKLCDVNLLLGLGRDQIKMTNENPSFPKEHACDGDESTFSSPVASGSVADDYWAADLGESKEVSGYRLLNGSNAVDYASAFSIYASNDADAWTWLPSGKIAADPTANDWVLVGSASGLAAGGDTSDQPLDRAMYRYWLFRATAGPTDPLSDWDIAEVELQGLGNGRAAPCDHSHLHNDLGGRDVDAAHSAGSITETTYGDVQAAIDSLSAGSWMPGDLLTSYPFVISGHRGDIGSADSFPENTLEGIQQAAIKGARMIEMDVQRSSQGTWYCMHDTTVTRTTDGTGTLSAMTDAAINALNIDAGYGYDAGRHGTSLKVPTLVSVLTILKGHDVVVNLDNKDTGGDAGATSLAELVVAQGWLGRAVIHNYTLTAPVAIKAVSERIHNSISTNVEPDPVNNPDVDEVIERETEWTSRADAAQFAPLYSASFIHPDFDYGIDETSRLEDMFSYGIRFYHTLNLDTALAVRGNLLFGTAIGSGNTHWEPVVFNSDLVYFNGDIVMHEVPN